MNTLQIGSESPRMRTPPTTRLCLQDSHCFESGFRTENKGQLNKRLYVRLAPTEPRGVSPA
jgi:hypothetical protein